MMSIMGVTNCFQAGFEVCSAGRNSCLLLYTWSMVGGVIGLSEKSTAVILLNEHETYVKLPKHLV